MWHCSSSICSNSVSNSSSYLIVPGPAVRSDPTASWVGTLHIFCVNIVTIHISIDHVCIHRQSVALTHSTTKYQWQQNEKKIKANYRQHGRNSTENRCKIATGYNWLKLVQTLHSKRISNETKYKQKNKWRHMADKIDMCTRWPLRKNAKMRQKFADIGKISS